jgi:membrane associated rhomboid family serine protease
MVIIPTEKSFDWQHTPFVLIGLVIFNVLVFFFYQSGDGQKLDTAYDYYEKAELFPIEWPIYKQYLLENNDPQVIDELQAYIDEGYADEAAFALLTDLGFTHHLHDNYRDLVPDGDYNEWSSTRPKITPIVESISSFRFGLVPKRLSVIDLIAYQFLHGDVMHILGNLFFLVVCGFAVEAAIGHLRFLAFYLITGIIGGLCHAVIDLSSSQPLIGASGAVSGVMAMYLGVFRLKKIEFFYWLFVFVGYFRAPALMILPFYIGKEVIDFVSSDGSNVAYMAHAGGFIAGALLISVSLWINPQTVNEEYVEAEQGNNDYQKKLAKVYIAIESFQFSSALKQVEAMIDEFGLDYKLATIRYNVGKIHKPEQYPTWVIDLLSNKTREPRELEVMQRIWRENESIARQLDDEKNIELAMRFANKLQFSTAEAIFKHLHDKQGNHSQLTVLAQKLSEVARQMNDMQKKNTYLQFAKTSHGLQS